MASSSDLESKAKEAFVDDHFELAIDLYSQAIALCPSNADLFVDRAQANIKLQSFTDAVSDANKAIELNPANTKAYLRKGVACINLEEFQTAKTALETGASLAPGDSRFTNLIKECEKRIAEETEELTKQLVDKAPTNVVNLNNCLQQLVCRAKGRLYHLLSQNTGQYEGKSRAS
ncbi:PREDICTED: protein SGT1 homolog [Erythranthe guttata]|nr:PREDICTED: protein SGT1 homolog [Erythranthe guttata]|eukprot:XP_012858294.1 PREDICTED: protein SGT1 homolog [Erythranthe guttata]